MARHINLTTLGDLRRGAVRPGILDILTALILLGLLVWASWKQFPAYHRQIQGDTAFPTVAPHPLSSPIK